MPGALLSILPILIAVVAVLALAFVLFKASWRVAEPNEALIISGRNVGDGAAITTGADESMRFRIITGQGTLVIPGIETVRRLDLNLIETNLTIKCRTRQAIDVNIEGSVIFKIGDTYGEIANAARRFLGKDPAYMLNQVHSIFAGHLRAIVGNMTMEELLSDRDKLRDEVRAASSTEMANLGLKIDSMQLLEIEDPSGYIGLIRTPHVAAAEAVARMAKAQQDQTATEKEQAAAIAMAEARTAATKRQAELQAEAETALKKAAQAGPLADAIAKQQVVEAETRTAELRADLTAKQLETDVRKPADAEAYAAKVTAEGKRDADIAASEAAARQVQLSAAAEAERVKVSAAANAESVKLAAEAEAARTKLQAEANANATRATGEAEAAATQAQGLASAKAVQDAGEAEAAAMSARADALAKGQDGLIAQQVATNMPAIVEAAVKPFANIKDLTVLNGGEGLGQVVVGAIMKARDLIPQIMSMTSDIAASSKSKEKS